VPARGGIFLVSWLFVLLVFVLLGLVVKGFLLFELVVVVDGFGGEGPLSSVVLGGGVGLGGVWVLAVGLVEAFEHFLAVGEVFFGFPGGLGGGVVEPLDFVLSAAEVVPPGQYLLHFVILTHLTSRYTHAVCCLYNNPNSLF